MAYRSGDYRFGGIGRRFGRLVVIQLASGRERTHVDCACDCGRQVVVPRASLAGTKLHTRSCGCLRREKAREVRLKHGHSPWGARPSRVYGIWTDMKKRCANSNSNRWEDYGGRGIEVCQRWNEFSNFLADMGEPPTAEHSLDRIDVNGRYEPSNCRWASRMEQAANTRANKVLSYRGENLHIAEWARRLNVSASLISQRIILGWSVEDALTKPSQRQKKAA